MSRPGDLDQLPYSWSLSSIIIEICLRAGIPYNRINVDGLDGTVDGFSLTANNDAFTGIDALARIYLFDASNYDGELHFIPRGGSVVSEIPTDNLILDDKEPEKLTRRDAINVPRVLNMEYYDVDGGLTINKQMSDRSIDSRAKSEQNMQTTVILRTEDAARAVSINHKVSIEEQRGEFEFSLPMEYIRLTNADCVMLDNNRIRITEVDIDEGQQNYKASFDRVTAYDSTIPGVAVDQPSEPPTTVVGATTFEFLDIKILADSDDRLGYYVAISGDSDAWVGAVVELSMDGGASYTESLSGTAESVIGTVTDVLAAHSAEYPDDTNILMVELLRSDNALESTDLAGMMNRVNLAIIGDELINFSNAAENSAGHWDLYGLIRGRKGTSPISHAVGERFVLLDRQALFFIDADLVKLNRDLTFRVTSMNSEQSFTYTYTFTGQGQIERQPAYLTAVRVSTNIVITWQGVGRLGGGATVGMGLNFAGYRVEVNGVVTNTLNQTLTVVDPGGFVTINVQQLNTLTGAGPAATVTL